MKKILINILQFLLFLGIGLVILFLVYRSQNETHKNDCCIKQIPQWESVESEEVRQALLKECREAGIPEKQCEPLLDKLLNDFSRVNYGWILLVLLAFILSNIHRTYKWMMLLRPLGYQPRFINGFLSIWVGYFANLGLPRLGEVVRAGVLSKYEKIPAEKVMGTIVVDRVVDMLCLAVTMGLALIFESEKILGYLNESQPVAAAEPDSLSWKTILFGLVALGVILVFAFRKRLVRSRLFQKLISLIKGFWEGIKTVGKLKNPGLFIYHSVSIWVLFFIMNWLGFQAFPPTENLGLDAALTVFVFGTLGFIIPSPGGMGTFQFLVVTALTLFYGIRGDDAFSIANIIFFAVQIGFNSFMGILSLLLLPVLNRKRKI